LFGCFKTEDEQTALLQKKKERNSSERSEIYFNVLNVENQWGKKKIEMLNVGEKKTD